MLLYGNRCNKLCIILGRWSSSHSFTREASENEDNDEESKNGNRRNIKHFQEIETAAGGTMSLKYEGGGTPVILPSTCIFMDGKRSTGYEKRHCGR